MVLICYSYLDNEMFYLGHKYSVNKCPNVYHLMDMVEFLL